MRIIETTDAALVYTLMQQAFEEYAKDVVPSSALQEQLTTVEAAQARGERALVAYKGDGAVGMVRFTEGEYIDFYRLSVPPRYRRQGIAKALVRALLRYNKPLVCKVRKKETRNMALYQALGFNITAEYSVNHGAGELTVVRMERPCVIVNG